MPLNNILLKKYLLSILRHREPLCTPWAIKRCHFLYSWTFKFHKVVRQQNSGAVEDFILYCIPQFIYESKNERIIEIGPHLPNVSQK